MRNQQQFNETFARCKWLSTFHKPRRYWIVPNYSGYDTSLPRPQPESLPSGTTAIQLDSDGNTVDEVRSSRPVPGVSQ